jgi:hypothetical protein
MACLCKKQEEKEMKKFRDFESAREFVQELKLTSVRKWEEYCKSGNKPDDIPSNPWKYYSRKNLKKKSHW